MTRRVRIALVAAVCLLVLPAVAVAAGGFSDVPATNVHAADIEWLADADVTRGCNPPSNTRYCPDDAVTRAQMASFLRRLATNGAVERVGDTTAEEIANQLPGYDGYLAYAWVTESGEVGTDYDFNPTGNITVEVDSAGVYIVTFGGEHPRIRNVSVSGYGTRADDCKVAGWGDDYVVVRCFSPAGDPVESAFTIWVTG